VINQIIDRTALEILRATPERGAYAEFCSVCSHAARRIQRQPAVPSMGGFSDRVTLFNVRRVSLRAMDWRVGIYTHWKLPALTAHNKLTHFGAGGRSTVESSVREI
jgi:hypothetical protein